MTPKRPARALLRGFIVSALFAAAALLPGACSRFSSSDTHLIGHLAPRSGPDGARGRRLDTAVAVVVEEANHDEPNRIEQRPITVVHADAGPELDGFTFQATRLIVVNKVEALIGGTDSRQLAKIAAAVQAQSNAPVAVSPCGGLAGAPSQLIWAVGLDPRERGKYLARGAVEQLGVAEVGTITDVGNPVFAAVRAGFEAEFRHADRSLGGDWTFADPKELPELAKKVAGGPRKAILFCGRAADLLRLRDELRGKLPEGVTYLFGGEEEEPLFRQEAARSNGVVFASAFTTEDKADRVQKFATDFRNRVGEPPDADAALSADAARVLFAAAARARSFRREILLRKDELPKLETELPTGPFWFSRDGEPRRTAYVLRMEGGSPKLLASFRPEKK